MTAEPILANVRVLAIGQNVEEQNGKKVVTGANATLELDPDQVNLIILAQHAGNSNLHLVLRSLVDSGGPAKTIVSTDDALTVVRYSVSKQRADGSWDYGEAPSQRWIDNFHTGYNLRALQAICCYAGTSEFEANIRRGFEFYRTHFFREDGAARYFHDRNYPIDIHCVAESILTLLAFKELDPKNIELAQSVFNWAMDHMWDERGFFYYRVLRLGKIRTSYMRWSQAWMLLAMCRLQGELKVEATRPQPQNSVALVQA
jgi:hypothetical protein